MTFSDVTTLPSMNTALMSIPTLDLTFVSSPVIFVWSSIHITFPWEQKCVMATVWGNLGLWHAEGMAMWHTSFVLESTRLWDQHSWLIAHSFLLQEQGNPTAAGDGGSLWLSWDVLNSKPHLGSQEMSPKHLNCPPESFKVVKWDNSGEENLGTNPKAFLSLKSW